MADPSTQFPLGTMFVYTATVPGSFFSSPDDSVSAIAAQLAQDGYQVLTSSVGTPSIFTQIGAATLLSSTPFTVQFTILDNNIDDDLGGAQSGVDGDIAQVTGNPPTSSSITSYTLPKSDVPVTPGVETQTGEPTQVAPGNLNLGLPSLPSLGLGSETMIAIVVIIIVLIAVVAFMPEAPARVIASFR